MPPPRRMVWMQGFQNKHPDMSFDPSCDCVGCIICGDVFQSLLDRKQFRSEADINAAFILRKQWAERHAKTHPQSEHDALRNSGRSCTAEAAYHLASYGLIPLSDLVLQEDVEAAGRETTSIPTKDADEPTKVQVVIP